MSGFRRPTRAETRSCRPMWSWFGKPNDCEDMYAKAGRPSISPEQLFRSLLVQVFYCVRIDGLLNHDEAHEFFARMTAKAKG